MTKDSGSSKSPRSVKSGRSAKSAAESEMPPEEDHGCFMNIRNKWARMQATAFANLGRFMFNNPYPFIFIVPCLYLALGWGVYDAELVSEPTELWVNKGSRLEDEKEWYETLFHGFPRSIGIQVTNKKLGRGANVIDDDIIRELYDIDGMVLDMRPHRDDYLMNKHSCIGKTQAQCQFNPANPTVNTFCGWSDADAACLFEDRAGLYPSYKQKNGVIYTDATGLQWGWREVCTEVEVPHIDNNIQSSPLSSLRAPCSKQQTPMDCFTTHARSQQSGVMDILGWAQNHPTDWDSPNRNKALTEPCMLWQHAYNAKGYTQGGVITDAFGTIDHISSWKFLYPVDVAEAFQYKYNNYIMNHTNSAIMYRSLGYPEQISLDQAEDIVEGWEKELDRVFSIERSKFIHSDITWLSKWNIEQIVEDASTKNQASMVIVLVLLLVCIWFLLVRWDKVMSRSMLGVGAVLLVGLSVFATLGLSAFWDIQFNGLSLQVLPYVAVGLGIDDVLVLLSYFDEDPDKDTELRFMQCYSHAGPSICATSIVNTLVFFLGTIVPVKAVNDFAFQAGISVVANFIIILFVFGPLLSLDCRRIQQKRWDVLCCATRNDPPTKPPPRAFSGKTAVEVVLGPIATNLPLQIVFMLLTMGLLSVSIWAVSEKITLGLSLKTFVEEDTQENDYLSVRHEYFQAEGNYMLAYPADWHLRENQIRLNTLVSHSMMNPENDFGIPNGTMPHSEKSYLVSAPAWSQIFRRFALQYPGGADPNNPCDCEPFIGTIGATYVNLKLKWYAHADPSDTRKVDGYLKDLPPYCTVNPDVYYDLLRLFMGEKTCLESYTGNGGEGPITDTRDRKYYTTSCQEFAVTGVMRTPVVPTCTEVESSVTTANHPYATNQYGPYGVGQMSPYRDEVKWNADGTLKGFRVSLINNPNEQSDIPNNVDMMEEFRALLDNSGIPVFATGQTFIYSEQYRYSRENLRTLMISCVLGAAGLTALLMASVTVGIIELMCLGSAMTVIIACLPLLKLHLNGVSLLSAVFGVGVNIELGVHIIRAFLVARASSTDLSPFDQRKERVVIALTEMSVPVFDGAVTSFVGVLVLAFSDTEFFREYFFSFYTMMILVALWHAFIMLPILLCWFGPEQLPPHIIGEPYENVDTDDEASVVEEEMKDQKEQNGDMEAAN